MAKWIPVGKKKLDVDWYGTANNGMRVAHAADLDEVTLGWYECFSGCWKLIGTELRPPIEVHPDRGYPDFFSKKAA